ncbi:MAG: VOC family protein [Acidobacteriaceae bacterium]|nr:VOC family protein [Acidobacteriaceae bacterium]
MQKLHHVGFVVASIDQSIESFCRSIGGSGWTQTWHDPTQQVRVAFIHPVFAGDASIELVEPASDKSPVRRFLDQQGGGLHHLCYEAPDINAAIQDAAARGATILRKPQPAVAFEGRRIAWVFTKEKLLIEYLESERE